jgi:hypothetical protein
MLSRNSSSANAAIPVDTGLCGTAVAITSTTAADPLIARTRVFDA